MTREKTIIRFGQLGEQLRNTLNDNSTVFSDLLDKAEKSNPWFIEEFVRSAIIEWGSQLQSSNIEKWLSAYPALPNAGKKSVAIIMAGNIPLVGLHDLICVLIAGHKAICKISSKDSVLLKWIIGQIKEVIPEIAENIVIAEDKLENFDAVIATGSNNSSRYFEYYFGKYPNILRRNRNSLALLSGEETREDFMMLAHDIFHYFGLGCRSVSKVWVPEGFDFVKMIDSFESYSWLRNNHNYANNYEYNKALMLMNNIKHLDNGFILVRPESSLSSPIGVLHYETYTRLSLAVEKISKQKDEIQCVVSNISDTDSVPLGKSQQPELWDYADNVDTLKFLLTL